jgi:hypothetical protein
MYSVLYRTELDHLFSKETVREDVETADLDVFDSYVELANHFERACDTENYPARIDLCRTLDAKLEQGEEELGVLLELPLMLYIPSRERALLETFIALEEEFESKCGRFDEMF